MTEQLLQFIANHYLLILAMLAVIGLFCLNEHFIHKASAQGLSSQGAVHAMNHEDAVLVDIRSVHLFQSGHIPNSKNIPHAKQEQLKRFQKKAVIFVCDKGIQAMQLANQLKKSGFEHSMYLTGGISTWKSDDLPITTGKK